MKTPAQNPKSEIRLAAPQRSEGGKPDEIRRAKADVHIGTTRSVLECCEKPSGTPPSDRAGFAKAGGLSNAKALSPPPHSTTRRFPLRHWICSFQRARLKIARLPAIRRSRGQSENAGRSRRDDEKDFVHERPSDKWEEMGRKGRRRDGNGQAEFGEMIRAS